MNDEEKKSYDLDTVSLYELLRKEGMERAYSRYGKPKNIDPTEYQYFAEGYKDGMLAMLNKSE